MRKFHYTLLLAFVLSICMSPAQDAKFKALFMYNFTKYLEWPPEQKKGDFIIEVLGNSPIIGELEVIAQKRKVGMQPIRIKKISSLAESDHANMLYIPENKSSHVTKAQEMFKNKGTVIITDKPGLVPVGAGINYVKVDGKQNFEVSKHNIEQQGLKVSSSLLSLGLAVE